MQGWGNINAGISHKKKKNGLVTADVLKHTKALQRLWSLEAESSVLHTGLHP
jgi:hypothetical protein